MTPFNLQILTPDKEFYSGETENLIVRTTVGDKESWQNMRTMWPPSPSESLR